MPCLRPRATTLPASQSSSRRLAAPSYVATEAVIGGRKARHPTIELRCKVRRKLDAGRATDRNRLVHQLVEKRPHVLVVADNAEGLARARRDAGGTRKQHELLPDVEQHMIRQRDLDVRSLHLLHVTGEHGIGTSVEARAATLEPCA